MGQSQSSSSRRSSSGSEISPRRRGNESSEFSVQGDSPSAASSSSRRWTADGANTGSGRGTRRSWRSALLRRRSSSDPPQSQEEEEEGGGSVGGSSEQEATEMEPRAQPRLLEEIDSHEDYDLEEESAYDDAAENIMDDDADLPPVTPLPEVHSIEPDFSTPTSPSSPIRTAAVAMDGSGDSYFNNLRHHNHYNVTFVADPAAGTGALYYPPPPPPDGQRRRSSSEVSSSSSSSQASSSGSSSSVSEMDDDPDEQHQHNRMMSRQHAAAVMGQDDGDPDFYPPFSQNHEWMGRSIESLLLGHMARAPLLQLPDDHSDGDHHDGDPFFRRRSTASTFNARRRSSSWGRRGSLSLSTPPTGRYQGGTLANYYNHRRAPPSPPRLELVGDNLPPPSPPQHYSPSYRRGLIALAPMTRRRGSMQHGSGSTHEGAAAQSSNNPKNNAGPNVLLHLLAREGTGRRCQHGLSRDSPATLQLRRTGGHTLFERLDGPAAGVATEVALLKEAVEAGDWAETHSLVSRLVVRLLGDPQQPPPHEPSDRSPGNRSSVRVDDPNLPPQAHRYYAGGGRLGLERDAFVQAGGVTVLMRMFREKSFVGQEMADSYDARNLGEGIVASRLAGCWNEALAALRELVYFMPCIVEDGTLLDHGDFLPFLFSLLSHDSCFDGAAALIEEILSYLSQTQQQQQQQPSASGEDGSMMETTNALPAPRTPTASTFFLGDVPDLYKLWRGFNCRQLAHFCRILALLVFEPEDRQLLESPAVLKSLELLQLRRNRAARAGRDSTVDTNQSILLGDEEILRRLLKLLSVMNYAPPLRRFSPYHVMAHFPFVADTLVMLGLGELERWDAIERQDALARQLLDHEHDDDDDEGVVVTEPLSELGAVADMLEGLSSTLGDNRQPNQISHIIQVISAAQQAGVIVGRSRRRRRRHPRRHRRNRSAPEPANASDSNDEEPEAGGTVADASNPLASVAGLLTDQLLVRRLYNQGSGQSGPDAYGGGGDGGGGDDAGHLINTPEDAANSLQFNAMLLGPYQCEVLFVLCTLLGGRRKLDAQDALDRLGVVPVLDDMFQRLPWYRREEQNAEDDNSGNDDDGDNNNNEDQNGSVHQPNGIHGPGCECTPESALCVQYLRMIHNFCDRDCDNYEGRRLLLSDSEKRLIFSGESIESGAAAATVNPGLLTKLTQAFIRESDESPYRFWLASCIESFLRGSSSREQLYVAQESGLLEHLAEEISSDKLHCAGSLQTSFDLLGELGKGNAKVIGLLVNELDEESFRRLMSVAAANLVDSNVFIRSLLLSLERLSARNGFLPPYLSVASGSSLPTHRWISPTGNSARSYLSHSWWDAQAITLSGDDPKKKNDEEAEGYEARPSDWFPSRDLMEANIAGVTLMPSGLTESVGHFGWVFTPVGDTLSANAFLPNTVERLSWFLAANQARLLRDLLGVVDLRNINHEVCEISALLRKRCWLHSLSADALARRRNPLFYLSSHTFLYFFLSLRTFAVSTQPL